MTEADRYEQHGFAYAEAWRILEGGCVYPPSFEGFQHMLVETRQQSASAITPEEMARRFVQSYRPVR